MPSRGPCGLAEQTDWRTDAATRFHASADAWRHDVAGLAAYVEGAATRSSRAAPARRGARVEVPPDERRPRHPRRGRRRGGHRHPAHRGGRLRGLAAELGEIAALVGSAGFRLFELSPTTWDASATIEAARRRILAAIEEADVIVEALRFAADVYDIVELRAERAAAQAAGDEASGGATGRPARARRWPSTRMPAARRSSAAFAHWFTLAGGARAAGSRNAVVDLARLPLSRDPPRLVGAARGRRAAEQAPCRRHRGCAVGPASR